MFGARVVPVIGVRYHQLALDFVHGLSRRSHGQGLGQLIHLSHHELVSFVHLLAQSPSRLGRQSASGGFGVARPNTVSADLLSEPPVPIELLQIDIVDVIPEVQKYAQAINRVTGLPPTSKTRSSMVFFEIFVDPSEHIVLHLFASSATLETHFQHKARSPNRVGRHDHLHVASMSLGAISS